MMDSNPGKISVSDATAHAACLTARDVNAAAIVTCPSPAPLPAC